MVPVLFKEKREEFLNALNEFKSHQSGWLHPADHDRYIEASHRIVEIEVKIESELKKEYGNWKKRLGDVWTNMIQKRFCSHLLDPELQFEILRYFGFHQEMKSLLYPEGKSVEEVEGIHIQGDNIQHPDGSFTSEILILPVKQEGTRHHPDGTKTSIFTIALRDQKIKKVNGLEKIDPNGVIIIDLSGNDLRNIQPEIFEIFIELETLNLSDNLFTQVPKLNFSKLPHLRLLRLRGNPILSLPEEFLKVKPADLEVQFGRLLYEPA